MSTASVGETTKTTLVQLLVPSRILVYTYVFTIFMLNFDHWLNGNVEFKYI